MNVPVVLLIWFWSALLDYFRMNGHTVPSAVKDGEVVQPIVLEMQFNCLNAVYIEYRV